MIYLSPMDKDDVYQCLDLLLAHYTEMSEEELAQPATKMHFKNLLWILWNSFQQETGNVPHELDRLQERKAPARKATPRRHKKSRQ